MTWHVPVNFASTTVSSSALDNTTSPVSFGVADGTVFGSSFPLYAVVDPKGTPEVIEVTARTSNTLTATRTSAVAHTGTPKIIVAPSAEYITELQAAVDAASGGSPAFVGACIRKKADTQTLSDNTLTKITYDTVVYDTGSIADTANDRLIAPQDGYYRVSFCCTSGSPSSGCSLMKLIKKNGTTIIGTEQRVSVPVYNTTATASITAYLLENDYVELFAQHYGGSYSIVTEDSWQIGANFLQIELVGV